jgi:hypothetical protein
MVAATEPMMIAPPMLQAAGCRWQVAQPAQASARNSNIDLAMFMLLYRL